MIIDSTYLLKKLENYSSPKTKISRMAQKNDILKIRRGLYIDKSEGFSSVQVIANLLYGPSYISFEYALSYYGLIPEKTVSVTSAVYNKNKRKTYKTDVGYFYYYCIPPAVYPYGIIIEKLENDYFMISTPEKALCDLLYRCKNFNTTHQIEQFLFEDMRLEEDFINKIESSKISFLAPLYNNKNMYLFDTYLQEKER
ncbi:MAG TPA: hypothetical protein P5123_10540 [Spirochaetota bacterium]|nr:hypothetical protein [Spirochaetota bacterium]